MKTFYGNNAFMMALKCEVNCRSYIDINARLVLLWDGATVAVFRGGFLIGECPTDYLTSPTIEEFNDAMQRIAQHYPLPQTG